MKRGEGNSLKAPKCFQYFSCRFSLTVSFLILKVPQLTTNSLVSDRLVFKRDVPRDQSSQRNRQVTYEHLLTLLTLMPGLIAKKVGMSRVFLPTGETVPVTYLEVEPNTVVRVKTTEKDGYNAIVLGVGAKQWRTRKGTELTRYAKQKEWSVENLDGMEAGKSLTVDLLPVESMVTVIGITKGKGFQGVVRRHGFGGGPGSHGSHFKREPGSIGMRADPGRVFKGHPMAGHMGVDQLTIKHRAVMVSDAAKGIIAIKGPVPGANGSHVYLTLESTK